jgi:hypothetical protein
MSGPDIRQICTVVGFVPIADDDFLEMLARYLPLNG